MLLTRVAESITAPVLGSFPVSAGRVGDGVRFETGGASLDGVTSTLARWLRVASVMVSDARVTVKEAVA